MKKRNRLMIRSFLLLSVSLFSLSCSHIVSLPDIKPRITLPASGDGYGISTVTHERERIEKEVWEGMRARGIVLTPDQWAILKMWILKQCLTNQCKQSVGALDSLFTVLDEALKKVGD